MSSTGKRNSPGARGPSRSSGFGKAIGRVLGPAPFQLIGRSVCSSRSALLATANTLFFVGDNLGHGWPQGSRVLRGFCQTESNVTESRRQRYPVGEDGPERREGNVAPRRPANIVPMGQGVMIVTYFSSKRATSSNFKTVHFPACQITNLCPFLSGGNARSCGRLIE